MSESIEVNYLLTVNVEDAREQIQQLERLIFRTLSLFRRMGLPEEVAQIIDRVQRLISVLRMLRLTFMLTQAAAGPIGWAMLAVSAATTLYEVGEVVEETGLYEWSRGKPPA